MKFLIISDDSQVSEAVTATIKKITGENSENSFEFENYSKINFSSFQNMKESAISRIFASENCSDFYISVLSGFDREFDSIYASTFAVCSDSSKNKFSFGTSPKFPIPEYLAYDLENGQKTVEDIICNDKNGLVSIATNGVLTINELVSSAIIAALIQFNFFPKNPPENAPLELTKFIDEIDPIQKASLCAQLHSLDFSEQKVIDTGKTTAALQAPPDPVDYQNEVEDAYAAGVDCIRHGEVAVCIMAGGQGSRLRAPVPKAMMEINIPSKMTLLEIQLRRIKKLVKMFNSYGQNTPDIPVYILTSESTHSPIAAYLLSKNNFGLNHVMLVKQSQLPARLESNNQFVLSEKWKVMAAPNGNGAIFSALKESGALDDMKKRGVRIVDIHPIDNALARPADPFFIGIMSLEDADCAIKVIRKRPKEKIGTLCNRDGKTVVVEYSEIPEKDESLYIWGNTGLHLYSIDLIEAAANAELPYHLAHKKENIVNEEGQKVLGDVKKYERFIFDALEYAENPILVECIREEEFAPIKNSSGAEFDSPETARDLIVALHKKWATEAGIILEGEGVLEFLPETTYAGEGIEELGLSLISLPMKI